VAKVEVQGTWVDDISAKVKATTNTLKSEFSVANAAQVALAGITGVTLVGAFAAARAEAEKLSQVYLEMERNNTRLGVALRLTGQYTQANVQALKDMANEAESQSGFLFDDAEILRAETYGLTIGHIAKEQMPETVRAAANLAAVLNTDLGQGMEAIVRGGIGMDRQLKQVGLQFDATGDQATDMKNIVQAVNEKFGDFAEKSVGPAERRIRELKDAIEDNDKYMASSAGGWAEWSANVQKALSDASVQMYKWIFARQIAMGNLYTTSPIPGATGVGGASGASAAPAMPPFAPEGSVDPSVINRQIEAAYQAQVDAAQAGADAMRKQNEEIELFTRLQRQKREALAGDAQFSDLSAIATLAAQQGAFPNLSPTGRSAYGTPVNIRDYMNTRQDVETQRELARHMGEARAMAQRFTSTVLNGLADMDRAGKITFRSMTALLLQIVDVLSTSKAGDALSGFFMNFTGGGSDPTTDISRGRPAGD